MDLKQIKRNRFDYLNKIYEEANGSLNAVFEMEDVGRELNLSYELTIDIVDYLINEGLIEPYALGGSIKLTHYGIKEIEQAYEDPAKPTEHFAPINYINIHSSGDGNIINTGNENVFTVINSAVKTEVVTKAHEAINIINNDPSTEANDKAAAVVLLYQLIEEVNANKPTTSTLNEVLTMGASIASIGSLVISIFQLLTH